MKKSHLLWPLFFLSHLLLTLLMTWHLLSQFHFAYPVAYQAFHIDEHIAHYAPQNRYKKHFEYVSSAEHKRIFGNISDAINHSGRGLSDIYYTAPNGNKIQLMHNAEIVHLEDVAKLINRLNYTGLCCLLLIVLLSALAIKKRKTLPHLKQVFQGFSVGTIILIMFVFLVGPKKVFYLLHTWVFPKDHTWFFYYQDSLMTTLMKAPDIFAFIAVLLVLVSAIVWLLSLMGFEKLFTLCSNR